jgi:hypothetical protein
MNIDELVDASFGSVEELKARIEACTGERAHLDMLEVNDMYGFFAARIGAGRRVIYMTAQRDAPWRPFRVRKVEDEKAAGWLRYTRWRPTRAGAAAAPRTTGKA